MGTDIKIKMVETNRDFYALYEELRDCTYAGLDIETTTDPWYDVKFKILTIAISTREGHAYVIPCEHSQAGYSSGLTEFKIVLERLTEQPLWIMQNGAFDYVALLEYGIVLSTPWFDTMVAQYMLDVELPKSLTALAQRWLGIMPWKDIDYKHPEEEDLTTLALLNGRDADYTRRLYAPLDKALYDGGVTGLYDSLMMPAVITLAHMEIDGVPVDNQALDGLISETEDKLETLLAQIRRVAGSDTFNPNSYKQMNEMLYERLALPVTVWTDKGSPSSNAEALANIKDDHPVVELIMQFRGLRKLLTASLIPWREKQDNNGLLHPRYKPAHAKTGRLSSEMPNIQQVPRDKAVRGVFAHPTLKIIEADYSQLELRVVSWLSGEGTMLAAFRNGDDLHQVTADAFGVNRQTAKALNFGLLYGAGPRKLRQVAKTDYGVELSELQAESLRAQWFTRYSAIEEFHRAVIEEATARGGVHTVFGRWRPLPELSSPDHGIRAHAERQAINTPVQSPASDITLAKLVELYNDTYLHMLNVTPMVTVHDSILFLCPPEYAEVAATYIKERMQDMTSIEEIFGVHIDVPLDVDIKISDRWGA